MAWHKKHLDYQGMNVKEFLERTWDLVADAQISNITRLPNDSPTSPSFEKLLSREGGDYILRASYGESTRIEIVATDQDVVNREISRAQDIMGSCLRTTGELL